MLRLVTSPSAAARLAVAQRFVESRPSSEEVVIVAASRGAADDLARSIARKRGATFGIARFSLTELAARAAAKARGRRAPGSQAGTEAIAARAIFEATAAGELSYFGPVAGLPGFPRALARTIHELRLSGVQADRLTLAGLAADSSRSPAQPERTTSRAVADLGRLLERVEGQLDAAAVDDRAALFHAASAACADGLVPWANLPLVLLDATVDSLAEREFVAALIGCSPESLALVPDGDDAAREWFATIGADVGAEPDPASPSSDLAHLRRYVFTSDRPPVRRRVGDVRLFSAPGEGREAVEIVRRVLDEAERGVPFDEMAVFLRAPQQYLGLIEHACARGAVPVYFDHGTRRPDPAGRAFIALISCAAEGLSAKRFDEYLSLGQVPRLPPRQSPELTVTPLDEVFHAFVPATDVPADFEETAPAAPELDSDDEAVLAGTLRAPWKWEELIVESAVVGGRTRQQGKGRWRRRLDGLAADFRFRIAELERDEPESPRIARYRRDLRNLSHLGQFALPIIDTLADWPDRATWGEWLDQFSALALRGLVRPDRVLGTLADLRPMANVGPVSLDEARDVLRDRLVTLDREPPARRYGRLFVDTPYQARGRAFRVVFVPGLAERVVPQRPREDPLLLDDLRRQIDPALILQHDRSATERLLLKIAIGAATERLYLSYPRMDVAETRARVPSFYALDVMRAMTGQVPDHRVLAAEASEEAGATLAWPAPRNPDAAIDDLEHDLAVLKPLLDSRDPTSVKGRAHYLLDLNEALRRSVISRWSRGRHAWSPSDGLTKVSPALAGAISASRLASRPYSLSALQRFSVCPYQFLLATIHRLQPWDEPEPLMRMDPLTRGSLFHAVQAEFYRTLDRQSALPVTPASLPSAARTLDEVLTAVATKYEENLAPAVDRVWRDEIGELGRDLGIWIQKLAADHEWIPQYFEFSFGLHDQGRDARSVDAPVVVPGGYVLHGSVDLIERHSQLDVLRVTDHKTGRDRSKAGLIVGGGAVLQPVLYSMAVEQALGKKVTAGRLFYCTTAGGFAEHTIDLTDYTRSQAQQVLTIIDRAVEQGSLVAAPAQRACAWCDFRPVCGPGEEARVKEKAPDRLADLQALRSMR